MCIRDSDYSGYSVSLSSDGLIVAIGAYGNDENGTKQSHERLNEYNGSIYVNNAYNNVTNKRLW